MHSQEMAEKFLPHLTPRLSLVASFVRRGVKVADIGTDHAYLPVWLVNSGICPHAVASDVAQGPLDRAILTARTYKAEEKIDFALANGLAGVTAAQADDIVIAGMGGELIAEILLHCPWVRDGAKHLVLQPMTAQAELRSFLCESGYRIEKEAAAAEKQGRKLYTVLSVYYTGEKRAASPEYLVCGELPRDGGAVARAYLEHQARSLMKKANGLRASKSGDVGEAREAEELAQKILSTCKTMGAPHNTADSANH